MATAMMQDDLLARLDEPQGVGSGGIATTASPWRGFLIGLGNAVLTIVTLGLYSFWARTRVRRWLWRSTSMHREPFEWTGTGGELLRGALLVMLLIILPISIFQVTVQLLVGPDSPLVVLLSLGLGAFFFYLTGVGRYRAARYRVSRTVHRGIRGGLSGSGWVYGRRFFVNSVLAIVSLGLTRPLLDIRLTRAIYRDMSFGDQPVMFEASARPLFARWLICWLLFLPTLGMSGYWYIAARERLVFAGLRWQGLSTSMNATGSAFLRLGAGNAAITIGLLTLAAAVACAALPLVLPGYQDVLDQIRVLALANETEDNGLQIFGHLMSLLSDLMLVFAPVAFVLLSAAVPVIAARNMRFYVRHLSLAGQVDWDRVAQNQQARQRTGEGLVTMLDAGGDI